MIGGRRLLSVLNLPLGHDANQLDLAFHPQFAKDAFLVPPDGLHGDISRAGNALDALPLDQGVQHLRFGRREQVYAVAENAPPPSL